MQDTDWITVVSEVKDQLLTAITTLNELRADMEYRRSTRPAPEQLVMTSDPAPQDDRPIRKMVDAPRRNRKWTDDETSRLVYMWLKGIPLADIANDLGRSLRSVEGQISDLRIAGMALPKRGNWTASNG